jgi:hypothetical protein
MSHQYFMQRFIAGPCQTDKHQIVKGKLMLFCICSLLIYLIACKKEEQATAGTMVFTWAQTQCDDPWLSNADNDTETIKNIVQYLKAAGLEGPSLAVTLKTESSAPANCAACSCPTGKTVYVSVEQSETLKEKYLQAGFTLKP